VRTYPEATLLVDTYDTVAGVRNVIRLARELGPAFHVRAVRLGCAPPERVWPWIAQLGADRGGWYSYDRIDNGGRPSATRILPEHQHVAPGDVLPAIPGATDAFVVASVSRPRGLILTVPGPDGGWCVSWEYLLEPQGRDRTRLIVRGRVSRDWLAPSRASPPGKPIFIERVQGLLARMPRPPMLLVARLGHRIMLARHLRGIRRRAEGELDRRAPARSGRGSPPS
jgi:hypothetical protein